jgi:hypothetical protein
LRSNAKISSSRSIAVTTASESVCVLGPGLFLTKGHVVEIFDATTGFFTSSRLNGQRTDICALLS